MPFDTYAECLKSVPESVAIHFLGMAEPWLNPDCTRMVLHAHDKGHRISVSTTLKGMRAADIDAMTDIPFEDFIVHVPADDNRMNLRVDRNYLSLLKKICRSRHHLRFKRFGALHPQIAPILRGVPEALWPTRNRANNLRVQGLSQTPKIKGVIHCHRKRNNVLLPNGDVVLCCNDYGLQHVIGNLLQHHYDALFSGDEFRRVRKGMQDDAAEILCRYCSEPCMKTMPSSTGQKDAF
jgi:hypothetical protein